MPFHLSIGSRQDMGVRVHMPWALAKVPLLLASCVLALAFAASPALAGFLEGRAAYRAKDFESAHEEFQKAAEQGHVGAQFWLGLMYRRGQGVERDHVEAVKWFRKAGERGNAVAQFFVGLAYARGQGVQRDFAEAVRWYLKAAEQGQASAQNNLGYLYGIGKGVREDNAESARWYLKAAEQGNAMAQRNIGIQLTEARGVREDLVEAYKWLTLSLAKRPHEEAEWILGEIEKRMTWAQIEEAKERAKNWSPRSAK